MKAEAIIKQLYITLPNLTDYFSDSLNVVSISRSGNTVTVVTSEPHNLTTGNYVTISGAKTPTLITTLTRNANIVTATTNIDHDLTEKFFKTVEIIGADQAEYNGTFELLRVLNRLTFTFKINTTPISPATGSEILLLTGGLGTYNGRFEVTIINTTTFTYQITTTPYPYPKGNIKVKKNIRISGAVSIDRAIEGYTKQDPNKMWAFVVLDDTQVNKDRFIRSDAVGTRAPGVDFRTRLIKNFSVYIIVPATNSISGRYERDLMEEIEVVIYKSLLGVQFPSLFTEETWSMITPIGHGFFDYIKAYYVHRFQFQGTFDILYQDTAINPITRAFRDLSINYFDYPEGTRVIAEAEINLDDEPL